MSTPSAPEFRSRQTTFGHYLTRRLRLWESESELASSTLASYREANELYFRPGLGHLRLVDLRDNHFRDLHAAMRLINRDDTAAVDPGLAEAASMLLAAGQPPKVFPRSSAAE